MSPLRGALLVAFLLLTRAVAASPCSTVDVRDALRARDVPVQAVTDDGRGGAFFFLGSGPEPDALAWAGRLPGGQLVSSQLAMAPGAADAPHDDRALHALFSALDEPALRACDLLSVGANGRADAAVLLDGLRRALGAPITPPHGATVLGSPLVVNTVSILAVLALLVLLAVQATRGALREPRLALQLAGLTALALAVRVLSAERHPVGQANGDLTHVMHAAAWLANGLGQDMGVAYPPSFRVLLYLVFSVTGPSLRVAFWLTTLVGALVCVPAALIARRLSPHPAAGVLAGVALATYPPSVLFSNGVDLSVPAGLLLTLAIERMLAARDAPAWTTVATSVLALLLFSQCRVEALGVTALVAVVSLALVVEHRAPHALSRLALAGLAAVLLSAPYLASLLAHSRDLAKADDALPLLGSALVATSLAASMALVAGWAATRWPRLPLGAPPVLAALTLGVSWFVAGLYGGNAFVPTPRPVPEFPFVTWLVDQGPWRYLDHRAHRPPWLEPGVFPFPWLALLGLSLLPSAARAPRRAVAPVALVVLPVAAWLVSSRSMTGFVPAEGLRLHVAYAGLVAAAVGLGAARAIEWLGQGFSRWAAGALLVALLIAPVGTHADVAAASDRYPAAELRFAERAMAFLPEGSTLVLPDDRIDMRRENLGYSSAFEVFRGDHLWRALAAAEGRRVRVLGLSTFLSLPLPSDGPVRAYLGVDCARVTRPQAESPSCRALRTTVAEPPLLDETIENRDVATVGLPWFGVQVPRLRLSLLPLGPSEVATLRRLAGSQLVNGGARPL